MGSERLVVEALGNIFLDTPVERKKYAVKKQGESIENWNIIKIKNMLLYILCAKERFWAVKSMLNGPDAESSNKGGHSGGLGMSQLKTCSGFEYLSPQSFWHWSPLVLFAQMQPHLRAGLSMKSSTTRWRITIKTQRINGNRIRRRFVFKLRFFENQSCYNAWQKIGWVTWIIEL